jgi:carbon monoxide dehydrogenase subunit G
VGADPGAIWDFLLTPERLRTCLPGCEQFTATDEGCYAATLRLGVAFFTGRYSGTVRVLERDADALVLEVVGSGPLGSLRATGKVSVVSVSPPASANPDRQVSSARTRPNTTIAYAGEATIGGTVAAAGQSVLAATGSRLIDMFFDCLASRLERAQAGVA